MNELEQFEADEGIDDGSQAVMDATEIARLLEIAQDETAINDFYNAFDKPTARSVLGALEQARRHIRELIIEYREHGAAELESATATFEDEQAAHQDTLRLLSGAIAALEQAQKETERLKSSEDQLIGERDAAEETLSQAYYLVIGRSPDWSSLFGHKEALEEIDDAQHAFRAALTQRDAAQKDARDARALRRALIEIFHYAQNLDDEWVMDRVRLALPDLGAESSPDV